MADLSQNSALVSPSNLATYRREYSLGYMSAKAGDVVVLDANSKWQKVDVNGGVGTNYGDTVAMLVTGGNTNQPAVAVQEDPALNIGVGVTNGGIYCGSPNAGAVAPVADITSGNVMLVLGSARNTAVINFKPITTGCTV